MTTSTENYLKTIVNYTITNNQEIRISKLSELLNIKPASVTEMIKKLSDKQLINHQPYKAIYLTKQGKQQGLKILRRHRLLELFLTECLQVSWDEVHEEAEALEHAVSDTLIKKIDAYLEFPKFDPHGDPIPQEDGSFPTYESISKVSEINIGDNGQIIRVSNDDKAFLNYLSSMKCNIGQQIKVIKKYEFDNSIDIQIGKNIQHISDFVSQHIWIIPTKKEN